MVRTSCKSLSENLILSATRLVPSPRPSTSRLRRRRIEVSGYAYDLRSKASNSRLSQQRADAVVRYLAETHRIPLRRIITPFGYGATAEPVADYSTREGRAENRRAEVRLLVNKGLSQPGPELNEGKVSAATPPE